MGRGRLGQIAGCLLDAGTANVHSDATLWSGVRWVDAGVSRHKAAVAHERPQQAAWVVGTRRTHDGRRGKVFRAVRNHGATGGTDRLAHWTDRGQRARPCIVNRLLDKARGERS